MPRHPRLLLSFLVSTLAAAPLFSQVVVTPPILYRNAPAQTTWMTAKRITSVDFTNEASNNVFALFGSGAIGYFYGPELTTAFCQLPTSPQVDMAPVVEPLKSGILVTNGTHLQVVRYGSASSPFAISSVSTSGGWSVVKLETFSHPVGQSTVTFVAGCASNLRTVTIGILSNTSITTLGTFTTATDVKQLAFLNFDAAGNPEIAARTSAGVEVHASDGSLLAPLFSAPNYLPDNACIARARNGQGIPDRLVWLHYDTGATSWFLRTYTGATIAQELQLNFISQFPGRCSIINIATGKLDLDEIDDIVLQQTTNSYQARLPGTLTGFAAEYVAFQVPETVQYIDNCPAILDDINHDGLSDLVMYQNHIPALGMILSLGAYSGSSVVVSSDALPPEGMTNFGTSWTSNTLPALNFSYSLRLGVLVPIQYRNAPPTSTYKMQIVVWHQSVTNPTTPYAWTPTDPVAESNTIVSYGSLAKPVVEINVKAPNGTFYPSNPDGTVESPDASPVDHTYLLYRFVKVGASGTDITWASPSTMVGFNAAKPPAQVSNYMSTISSQSGKPPLSFAGNKNVGTIKKPDQLDPPWPVGSTPSMIPTAGVAQMTTTTSW